MHLPEMKGTKLLDRQKWAHIMHWVFKNSWISKWIPLKMPINNMVNIREKKEMPLLMCVLIEC